MLGQRIRMRRRALDWTQAHLATLSGIPQWHLSAIERGRIKVITSDTLRKLAVALQVSADWLLEIGEQDSEMLPTGMDLVPA